MFAVLKGVARAAVPVAEFSRISREVSTLCLQFP